MTIENLAKKLARRIRFAQCQRMFCGIQESYGGTRSSGPRQRLEITVAHGDVVLTVAHAASTHRWCGFCVTLIGRSRERIRPVAAAVHDCLEVRVDPGLDVRHDLLLAKVGQQIMKVALV
jgi:hypothetical protein